MVGQAAASTVSISSAGMLRIWKMPACLASIRNITLSLPGSLAVTVMVMVTSYTPSSIEAACVCNCRSICGCSRSRKIPGECGTSSDRSFTYSFSILKTGWSLLCAVSVIIFSLRIVRQHRIQFARAVQCCHIVITADMLVVDKDLRHRAAVRLLNHYFAHFRMQINTDLFDLLDALALQQLLGAYAIRTHFGAIHHDFSHYLSSGRLAFCQAMTPPFKLTAYAKPFLPSNAQADAERCPLRHTTTIGRSRYFSSSPMRS